MALHRPGPDALPNAIEAAALRRLERSSTSWLHELVAVAERRGVAELARLARQVLALRGETPDTGEAGDR